MAEKTVEARSLSMPEFDLWLTLMCPGVHTLDILDILDQVKLLDMNTAAQQICKPPLVLHILAASLLHSPKTQRPEAEAMIVAPCVEPRMKPSRFRGSGRQEERPKTKACTSASAPCSMFTKRAQAGTPGQLGPEIVFALKAHGGDGR